MYKLTIKLIALFLFLTALPICPQTPENQTSKIGDRVWNDLNRNGLQDPGEPGLPFVTVNLYDCNGTWLDYKLTDEQGYFEFLVQPGSYYFKYDVLDILPQYVYTEKHVGNNPEIDSDVNPSTGQTDCFTVTANQSLLSIDAGAYDNSFTNFASVGDRVWKDLNQNGIQDPGEPGLQWVTVNLYNCNEVWLDYKLTDENGYYYFGNLVPGTYYLKFVTGNIYTTYVFSPPYQGNDPELDSDADPLTGKTACFTLADGQTDLSIDAGLYDQYSTVLWVTKDDYSIFMPPVGGSVTYDIKYGNSSGETFYGVTVIDTLPDGTSFLSCSGAPGCGEIIPGSGVVVFYLDNLTPSQQGLLKVSASVNEFFNEYTNIAWIRGKDGNEQYHYSFDTDINIGDTCSGGGGGGIESRGDLAELLLKRHLKIQYGMTTPLVSNNKWNSFVSFELEQFIPETGPMGSIPLETTPFDILGISNAIASYAVDYNLTLSTGERRVAAIFSTITPAPEIYNHTKVVCDRLSGSALESIELLNINGHLFYSAKLYNPGNNSTDYAVSFSAYETANGFHIENKWAYQEYEAPIGTMNVYNFQIWSGSAAATIELVKETIALLNSHLPVVYMNVNQIPPVVFIKNAEYRHDGTINMTIVNTGFPKQLALNFDYRVSQGSDKLSSGTSVFAEVGITEVNIPFGIISDAEIKMYQQQGFMDEVYVSSGAYTYIEGQLSTVTEFQTSGYPQPDPSNYPDGSYILSGGFYSSGNLNDWVSVIRSLKANWTAYDLSRFNSLSFTAEGYGTVDVFIEMTNTQNFNYYVYPIELNGGIQNYNLNFNDFYERFGPQAQFDPEKIRAIGFIIEKYKNPGVNQFSLEVKNISFQTGTTGSEQPAVTPSEFLLMQNFPNPFNPSTTIEFSVAKREHISLKIFNILGQEVHTLINQELEPGYHSVKFDASSFASGIYFYRLNGSSVNITKKMILSK